MNMDGALPPIVLDKLKTEPRVSKDAVVAQDDDKHPTAPSLHWECDVPLDIVKKETDSFDIDEAAIEQYYAEPKHSVLDLHSEYEIKRVKEEPDDVDTVAAGKPESHAISYVPSATLALPPSLPLPLPPLLPLLTTPSQKNRWRASASPRLAVTTLRRRSMLKARRNWRLTPYERVADILAAVERRRLESEEARDRGRLEFEEVREKQEMMRLRQEEAREKREMERLSREKAREKREMERLRLEEAREKREIERLSREEAREKREMERLSREEAREKREMERLSREEARDKRLHDQEMKMLREKTALLQRLNDIGQRLLDVLTQQRPVGSLPSAGSN